MEKAKRSGIEKKDFVISSVIALVAVFQFVIVLQNAGLMDY